MRHRLARVHRAILAIIFRACFTFAGSSCVSGSHQVRRPRKQAIREEIDPFDAPVHYLQLAVVAVMSIRDLSHRSSGACVESDSSAITALVAFLAFAPTDATPPEARDGDAGAQSPAQQAAPRRKRAFHEEERWEGFRAERERAEAQARVAETELEARVPRCARGRDGGAARRDRRGSGRRSRWNHASSFLIGAGYPATAVAGDPPRLFPAHAAHATFHAWEHANTAPVSLAALVLDLLALLDALGGQQLRG